MVDTSPSRPQRLRFSILTLVLVTTIVGLSITVAMLYREVGPLRKEVARLRNEVGELNLQDRTMMHAIRVDTDNELEWKWRIWLPEGAGYRLRSFGGKVPKVGYPKHGGTMYLRDPGEHVVRYRIRRDPRDGQWNGSMHTRGGSVGKNHQPWVDWSSTSSTGSGVGTITEAFEIDQQVEIIRHRVSETAKSSTTIEDPAAGFLIWLEPI